MEVSSRTARFRLSEIPAAPVPIAAVYSVGDGRVHITFSEDLVNGPYTPANFRAWDDLTERIVTGALRTAANTVRLLTTAGPVSGGVARTTYLATPPELTGLVSGVPVAAYSDFPVTVV